MLDSSSGSGTNARGGGDERAASRVTAWEHLLRYAAAGVKKSDLKAVFFENARSLLAARGLLTGDGIRALSRAAGVGAATALRMERGQSGVKLDMLEQAAKTLGVQPWQLLYPGLNPAQLPQALPYSELAVDAAKMLDAIADAHQRSRVYGLLMQLAELGARQADAAVRPVAEPAPAPTYYGPPATVAPSRAAKPARQRHR